MALHALTAFGVVASVAADGTARRSGACANAVDCELNGECHSGVCSCYEGWVGESCSPGTIDAGVGRSSIGQTGSPVSRLSTKI